MNGGSIDEKRIEDAFENLRRLRRSAWNLSLAEAAALSERVRVEIILDKSMNRSQKRWYRAYSDFVDDVVDERMEKEGVEREVLHGGIIAYIRNLLHSHDRGKVYQENDVDD